VRIITARLHAYHLPLRAEWVTAAGSFSWRDGWLLQLETDDGRFGYGDCAPLTGTGTESTAVAEATLRSYARKLVGLQVSEALAALAETSGSDAPTSRCAVETALLDLLAKAENLPLSSYLQGAHGDDSVTVNAALGSLLRVRDASIISACADGFSVLKLKVGSATIKEEISRLQQIAALLPAGVELRLDANRAWTEADAAHFLDACTGLPIEMVEEPLANPLPDALQRLQASCAFALALDESLHDLDSPAIFNAPVRRLILKPPRHGGLLPTLTLARHASAAGLQCIVTSSVDSACGVLAAAHLAAALNNGLAHGLATSSWLAADTGSAPIIVSGRLQLPDAPGLGFTPDPDRVL
jgi:o-succinylbenzoate synthase